MVPKDKAIKRFIVRNMVDASAIRDLQDACAIDGEPVLRHAVL
jgi:small subunit ribosomal protein S26e